MSPWVGFKDETNGLPAGLLRGLSILGHKDRHGDFSVTELVSPPQLVALAQRYDYETSLDDQLWALFGKALHNIIEQGMGDGELGEEPLTLEFFGLKVEGTPDLWNEDTVWDLKSTSVWVEKYEHGGIREEWVSQVNLYAYMLRRYGFEIQKAQVIVVYRDWREYEKHKYDWYPPARLGSKMIGMWADDVAHGYLRERLELHRQAREMSDEILAEEVPCSAEETWSSRRCQQYCPVASRCKQWSKH